MYHTHAEILGKSEEGAGSLGTGVLRGCEPSWGCLEQSPGLLEAANSLTAVPGASLLLAQESEPQESWLICLCFIWVPGLTTSESWTSSRASDTGKSQCAFSNVSFPVQPVRTQLSKTAWELTRKVPSPSRGYALDVCAELLLPKGRYSGTTGMRNYTSVV